MNDNFKLGRNNYSFLRNFHLRESQNPGTNRYSLDCITYGASQIWQTVPIETRDSILLKVFKNKIKKRHCSSCPCYCCKP